MASGSSEKQVKASSKTSWTKVKREILSMQKSADRASDAFEHQKAIDRYSKAIELVQRIDLADARKIEFELLASRDLSFEMMGDWGARAHCKGRPTPVLVIP